MKKKILIAHPNEDMCWVLDQILNSAGYDTCRVRCQQKLSHQELVDFLVLDYTCIQHLDEMMLELTSKYFKENRAVLISSLSTPELKHEVGEWYCDFLLQKPFDINELLSIINNALRGEA
jgi:DNA-binding NtrC family response regulator